MYEGTSERREAARLLEILARGVDPSTNVAFAETSVFNEPLVIRALYSGAQALRILAKRASADKLASQRNSTSDGSKDEVKAMAGKPWTAHEDNRLRHAFAGDFALSGVAKEHQRSVGGIKARLVHLGLISERSQVS